MMSQSPIGSSNTPNLIQQAAFDYLNNTFSQNPAQPLRQGNQGGQGSVSQPQPQQSHNLADAAKSSGIMKSLCGAAAA